MAYRDSHIVLNVIGVMVLALAAVFAVWLFHSVNPTTPAGYVGYVTQGAWFGKARFLDTQVGPTSYGRTWLADVINVALLHLPTTSLSTPTRLRCFPRIE